MVTEETAAYSYTYATHPQALADPPEGVSDAALQSYLLQGVSRTFALTIPQLPPRLAHAVANAYLLCRLIDTIEDEPELDWDDKHHFCQQFVATLTGRMPPERFAQALLPKLSARTPAPEQKLIAYTTRVVNITHSLTAPEQQALIDCIHAMAAGMVEFQATSSLQGLRDVPQLDRYCYYVAGVVGEMLTKLFCEHSPEIARRRQALMTLAVSFGQGLQMTNILKDMWDDRERGACWLPEAEFAAVGFNLQELAPGHYRDSFGRGLEKLIAITHGHLRNALTYTLLIPRDEPEIRRFCLLALGMAVLTLRKINNQRDFSRGSQVKISRRSVKLTLAASQWTAKNDYLLRALFWTASLGLPTHPPPKSVHSSLN